MWSNISSKWRFYLQLIGCSIFLIIGYILNFSKSINAYHDHQLLSSLSEYSEAELLMEIKQLTEDKRSIDSILVIKKRQLSPADLYAELSGYADRYELQIRELKDLDKSNGQQILIELDGTYLQMIKFIRKLELDLRSIEISSLNIERKFDRQLKTEFLTCTIYLNRFNNE